MCGQWRKTKSLEIPVTFLWLKCQRAFYCCNIIWEMWNPDNIQLVGSFHELLLKKSISQIWNKNGIYVRMVLSHQMGKIITWHGALPTWLITFNFKRHLNSSCFTVVRFLCVFLVSSKGCTKWYEKCPPKKTNLFFSNENRNLLAI